jgi:hypothetical protein
MVKSSAALRRTPPRPLPLPLPLWLRRRRWRWLRLLDRRLAPRFLVHLALASQAAVRRHLSKTASH